MEKFIPYRHNGIVKWRRVEVAEPIRQGTLRDYLGESLREVRKSKNMNMRDISGISLGFISEIERGIKEPSSEILEAFCNETDTKLSELLRKTADKLEKVGK